ncbi:MAG: TrmH family RNA methyltransferase, partial [Flavobacteriales bacterium]|nr:TrmH family RNA methyltransferase [Flavobacteriales bacterium]
MRKLKNSELGRISSEDFKNIKKSPIVLVLDNIRSAMNVGSIFRTADAFLIEKIYLCGITAIPPNKELMKTALGANDSIDWEYVRETSAIIKRLKIDNHHISLESGNIFLTNYQTIVITVNCAGVMGKGIALQAKDLFPDAYEYYKDLCEKDEM